VLNELEKRDACSEILFLDNIYIIFYQHFCIVVLTIQLVIRVANVTINICTFISCNLSLYYLVDIIFKAYELAKNFISTTQKSIITSKTLIDIPKVICFHFKEKSIQNAFGWLPILILNWNVLFPIVNVVNELVKSLALADDA
jgi:hypothetical protein